MLSKLKEYLSFHKDGLAGLKFIKSINSSVIPLTILFSLVKALYPYINLFISAYIIDFLINKEIQNAIYSIIILIASNLLFGIIQDILENLNDYNEFKIGYLTVLEIRKKALSIDYETLEDAKTLENINSAVYAMRYRGGFGALLNNYCSMLESIFIIIISSILLIYLCFQTSLVATGVLSVITSVPFSIVIISLFFILIIVSNFKLTNYMNDKSIKLFQKQLKAERTLSYFMDLSSNYEMGKVIRFYNMKELIRKRFSFVNDKLIKLFIKSFAVVEKNVESIQTLISGICLMFSYIFVMLKVVVGAITIGSLTKYVGALTELNNALTKIVTANDSIRVQCEYIKKFNDFMKLENKRETGTIPIEKRLDNEYEIEFHNVSFAYPGSDEMILKNVSCKINMKNKMAIVGRNGAGKTTFIKLITRLYDPTEGYITLNGVDIKKYDYKEYLKLFSVVFQDFSLFAFPIEQNIVANTEVEEEKVWDVLELAGVKDAVLKMPLKLKTPLFKYDKDGVECSGGEMQKMAIARALYKDGPFVILDEPTAALDPISEYEIYSRFNQLVKDKTSIYISHRMSSCRFCDDIMVFDNGSIIQRGSHDELIKNSNGVYFSLWNAQANYYIES